MNQTSNGMNGNSRQLPPLPLMARPLPESTPGKDKAGAQNHTGTALPPTPRAAKRARGKAPERQAMPADVADLISFAQAYPAQGSGSETPGPQGTAGRPARSVPGAGRSRTPAPKLPTAAPQPSGALQQNFREAYSESFREALESYRENVRPQEPEELVGPVTAAPKRPSRSRLHAGGKAVLPEQTPQAIESEEFTQPEESPTLEVADPPRVGLVASAGLLARRVLRRTVGFAASPVRGLRTAWSWYQGRRVLQIRSRRMRVAETISLGEKRFLAVVEVDDCQFLVGGGASSVAVLAQLGTLDAARNLMNQRATEAQA